MNDQTNTNNLIPTEATVQDLKLSLILTSFLANAFILIAWLVLSYGTGYQLVVG